MTTTLARGYLYVSDPGKRVEGPQEIAFLDLTLRWESSWTLPRTIGLRTDEMWDRWGMLATINGADTDASTMTILEMAASSPLTARHPGDEEEEEFEDDDEIEGDDDLEEIDLDEDDDDDFDDDDDEDLDDEDIEEIDGLGIPEDEDDDDDDDDELDDDFDDDEDDDDVEDL